MYISYLPREIFTQHKRCARFLHNRPKISMLIQRAVVRACFLFMWWKSKIERYTMESNIGVSPVHTCWDNCREDVHGRSTRSSQDDSRENPVRNIRRALYFYKIVFIVNTISFVRIEQSAWLNAIFIINPLFGRRIQDSWLSDAQQEEQLILCDVCRFSN